MQHEGEAFGGAERLEHHLQGQADRVGEQRLLLRVGRVLRADHRVGHPHLPRLLAAYPARAQHVQADPADHGGQPAAQVADRAPVDPGQAQPGLLHRVLGLRERAQHPVGDGVQVRAVRLELVGQKVFRSHAGGPLPSVLSPTLTPAGRGM